MQYYNKCIHEPTSPNISHVVGRKEDFSFLRAFPRACALVQWFYLKGVRCYSFSEHFFVRFLESTAGSLREGRVGMSYPFNVFRVCLRLYLLCLSDWGLVICCVT